MATQPFKVIKNDILGRYMVANKYLKQGELILKEAPVLVGPHLNGPARCFKCLEAINLLMCSFCNECNTALICTKNCDGIYHNDGECLTLKAQKIKGQILAENPSVIFPLRCLLLSMYNPQLFDEILELESHLEARRDTPIWRRHRISVEDVLKETNLLTQKDLEDEVVQKICGILDVNSFELRPPRVKDLTLIDPEKHCLRGIYPTAAMMAHDCIANTHLAVDDNFQMSIYASVDIKENEPIYFNYANVLQGNQERQRHLKEGKYFECHCKRCEDPSEMRTEISSLVCHKCRRGFLRYTEIEKGFKLWKCNECKICFKDFLINLAIEEARRRIDDLDPTGIRDMEDLYRNLLLTFHPNHYLMLELKQNMVGLYFKLPPTKHNLNRKIDLCGRLMSVFSKLEPGISRIKALTMYEMQSAVVDISNKQYRDKEIDEAELVRELQMAEKLLKESIKYLLYEPAQSPEGRMAQMALSDLKMLRNSIKNIQQDVLVERDNKKKDIARRLKEKLNRSNVKKQEEEQKITEHTSSKKKHRKKNKK